MAKVLFILMPTGFKDVEFQTPYDMLKNAGHARGFLLVKIIIVTLVLQFSRTAHRALP